MACEGKEIKEKQLGEVVCDGHNGKEIKRDSTRAVSMDIYKEIKKIQLSGV